MEKINYNEDKLAIRKLLEKMQEGYTRRAVENIDAYTNNLFVKNDSMVILGTSDGEWCLGYEQSKKLLENDWKYWGNVIIDIDRAHISVDGNVAWFYTEGSVEQDFKATEETYDGFLENVKEYLVEDKCWLGELSNESKLTTIAWELTHLLSGEGKRYKWQIRLTGVAIKDEKDWKFTQLQFSLPTTSRYPDERIWKNNCYEFSHEKGFEKLRKYNGLNNKNISSKAKSIMDNFNKEFLDSAITPELFFQKYFSTVKKCTFIGTNIDKYNGAGICNAVENYKKQWDTLNLGLEDAIISEHEGAIWLISQGEAKKRINYENAIKMEMEKAKEIIESGLSSKEKLHKINRNILTMINEASKGEEFVWPIRFEAVLTKEDGSWLLNHVQFSYPSNIILEGKTDAAVLISQT